MAIVPSTAEILSRSMSVFTTVPDFAMPVMNWASTAPPKSGVGTEIDQRNHFATEVDDALDVLRHVRHGRNRAEADDLAHLQHRDAVRLLAKRERQVFARLRTGGDLVGGVLMGAGCFHREDFRDSVRGGRSAGSSGTAYAAASPFRGFSFTRALTSRIRPTRPSPRIAAPAKLVC